MIAAVVGILLTGWLCRTRVVAAMVLCFLLFSFVWRIVAAGYIWGAGPIYASELERVIAGKQAAEILCAALTLTIVVLFIMLRPSKLRLTAAQVAGECGSEFVNLGDLVFLATGLFIGALYIDMLARGVVPLFECMERYVYASEYAGPFHQMIYRYGPLFCLQLGTFTIYPRLLGLQPDLRFFALFALLLLYFLLTGNRFSAFYSSTAFYVMPFAAYVLHRKQGTLPGARSGYNSLAVLVTNPRVAKILALVLGIVVVGALANSYVFVRSEEGACKGPVTYEDVLKDPGRVIRYSVGNRVLAKLEERFLIQPVELWWLTWERVAERHWWQPEYAAHFIFVDPGLDAKNSSIRFLMRQALSTPRAAYLEKVGNQYAGGYPEVYFELFGTVGAWPAIGVVAMVSGWLLRIWILSLASGRLTTAFWCMYVFYAFAVMYIGGMMTFLIAWKFWGKVALFLSSYWWEWHGLKQPLIPWVIQHRKRED